MVKKRPWKSIAREINAEINTGKYNLVILDFPSYGIQKMVCVKKDDPKLEEIVDRTNKILSEHTDSCKIFWVDFDQIHSWEELESLCDCGKGMVN